MNELDLNSPFGQERSQGKRPFVCLFIHKWSKWDILKMKQKIVTSKGELLVIPKDVNSHYCLRCGFIEQFDI